MKLNTYIDHTQLKAIATPKDIIKLCDEAKEYDFFAVCVNTCHVKLAANELKDCDVKVAAVVGFPLGANSSQVKIYEAHSGIKEGASEIDMVLNVGWLKAKRYALVEEEIAVIKKTIGEHTLKVILETCYLSDDEIRMACQIAKRAGADFVKTSTGFGTAGTTAHHVKIMHEEVGDTLKIKASGGIRDTQTAVKYINLGVSRIGTSSGIDIVTSANKKNTDEYTY
ncbi:deoxyribose-phosphate aldolase [Mesonia sp. MT50]|uniref:Deoxyribose-phosphate aldolase n=1 Tax=Mesonia profundi TaxID=3070998 RepID=A0ABU1A4N0_9FLAO|nr:deoxyribose-phosphate aldolase [Mesonia profundi]MDQ7918668.1 deoxyribose-phosphate aldolase [Mesonia profundi]